MTDYDRNNFIDEDGYFFHVPGRFFGCTLDRHYDLEKASQLFENSCKDVLENWDHYYQVCLDEVSGIKEDV